MISITITKGAVDTPLYLKMLNRHGLIAGATGTGKTVTLKVITEKLSQQGIPVFLADIKGDLSGLAKAGQWTSKMEERYKLLGITDPFEPQAFPVRLWDVFGQAGHPVRATIEGMGSLLLARLLDLNETQTGILAIVFKLAKEKNWPLIDLKDLQSLLKEVYDHASDYSAQYGNISKQSVGAIQRSLLVLEQEGADQFFGEPALDLQDFMQLDSSGRGYINILSATRLFNSPKLYSTFLIWMLSRLFETLPEVGDLEKPKFVFFFDEAHLLFNDASKLFLEKVEQVVRLIRSKGVGIYFITQNPQDLPESVLAQLGNRVQHALRAYTPKEMKAIKVAAQSFRPNPEFDTETVLTELGTGEALVSFLNEKGQPSVVERSYILSPQSSFGLLNESEQLALITSSPFHQKYAVRVDNESAYEKLTEKSAREEKEKEREEEDKARVAEEKASQKRSPGRPRKSSLEKAKDSFISSLFRTIAREVAKLIMGSFKRK